MVGEVIAERYELQVLVEHGGMSSVYRGYDRMLERNVALKVLHPQFRDDAEYVERFRREARAVAQLSHPHIVTVIDRGVSDGHQYIVFEFIAGENLKQMIERTGPLPVRRVIELGIQIADALAFAHAHGIVHRDVKPQNVLIDGSGEAKVTDFGIARTLDVERGVTQTGTVLGTSNYLSPEQAEGAPVTPASDVYSLGVVLYELLTGDVPFRGDNLVVVAMKHVTEDPPDVAELRPDIPPRLAQAVRHALEKQPEPALPVDGRVRDRAPALSRRARRLRRRPDDRARDAGVAEARPHGAPAVRRRLRGGPRTDDPRSRGPLVIAGVIARCSCAAPPRDHRDDAGGGSVDAAAQLRGVGDYDPQRRRRTSMATARRRRRTGTRARTGTRSSTTRRSSAGSRAGLGLVLDAGKTVKRRAHDRAHADRRVHGGSSRPELAERWLHRRTRRFADRQRRHDVHARRGDRAVLRALDHASFRPAATCGISEVSAR